MLSSQEIVLVLSAAIAPTYVAFAETIERPAGQVIRPSSQVLEGSGIESSKSKLVPILRKSDLATSIVKKKEPEHLPHTNAKSNVQKNWAPKQIGSLTKTNVTPKTAIKEKSKIASAYRAPIKQKRPLALKAISEADSLSDDPWDSASKRFDQNDPSASVTNGVRVEDIIEPSSDYRYSGARKKNPFIPAVVIGRGTKQKELNPNDVEIPIINPLQSFAVSQLSVIGVWEGDDGVWKALIQTPTNQGIETKLGDPAGNSGGRIMSITPDAVSVREFSVRADGTREYRDIPLYMGSDKRAVDPSNIGGRVILRPGSSTPEIEPPTGSETQSIDSENLAPGPQPGTMKTVVPGSQLKMLEPNEPALPSTPMSMPAGVYPGSMLPDSGGVK